MTDLFATNARAARAPARSVEARPARRVEAWARRALMRRLEGLEEGRLTIVEPRGETSFGRPADDGLEATLVVHDPGLFRRLALGGSVGAGEAFMDGAWTSPDLTALVRLLVRNRPVLVGFEGGPARAAEAVRRLLYRLRDNTRRGSRRNIEAHYDLGNDFFALFLDPTLMYSCAFFEQPSMTLEEASIAKIDRICRRLDLRSSDRLLEIGTGWGGFALHAAERYGCRVTTTTISPAQHAFASRRIRAAGLADRVEVLERDYRDLDGRFDKLVSIEMIEAVGERYLDTFFQVCADRLEPHGRMVLQAITIADRNYASAARSVDFIQRYIFPGGFVPSVGALADSIARTDLTVRGLEDIGRHYAETLRRWRLAFLDRLAEAREQGFPERFLRMWEFYFCYCEGGFLERAISDVQMVLDKPRSTAPRSSIGLPAAAGFGDAPVVGSPT